MICPVESPLMVVAVAFDGDHRGETPSRAPLLNMTMFLSAPPNGT
jgi:hypothetical protein